MSNHKPLGPAAAVTATLPVTGASTVLTVMMGVAVLVVGLLLVRAARPRRASAGR